jgi:hypothetical protein
MTESPKKDENPDILKESKKSVKKSLDYWEKVAEDMVIDKDTSEKIKEDVKSDPFTTMIFVLGIIAVIGFISFGYIGYSYGAHDMAVNVCQQHGASLNESSYSKSKMSFECTKTIIVGEQNEQTLIQ